MDCERQKHLICCSYWLEPEEIVGKVTALSQKEIVGKVTALSQKR